MIISYANPVQVSFSIGNISTGTSTFRLFMAHISGMSVSTLALCARLSWFLVSF